MGKVEGDTLIIYYNSEEPRWTASSLIHEVTHIALDINRKDMLDTIIDEVLAYTASFKSGYQDLYLKGTKQAIEILSSCRNPYNTYELVNIIIPRILAHRLTRYSYTYLVKQVMREPKAVFSIWLETSPEESEIKALAIALKDTGLDIGRSTLEKGCREEQETPDSFNRYSYEFEGVDRNFLKMIELLNEAARNKQKAYDILKPWWNELKEIKYELEAYLEFVS
ncbi:MAG: hypothetical protein DRO39_04690 [Thermoprotei archaeon]|nr:MAG: hypothetical protein DRO39_04690 [Thermoprotei archaeon]